VALDQDSIAALREGVARFVRKRLIPAEQQISEEDRIPDDLIAEMKALGLFGLTLPEEYGGLELSIVDEMAVIIELSYAAPVFRSVIGANNSLGGRVLVLGGTLAQKRKYLPDIAAGNILTSFALTEPGSGSDASALTTTAARRADGAWVLNGAKRYITNAPVADLITVVARAPGTTRAQGVSAFLVEKGTPGMNVAKSDAKMGQAGTKTADIYFENCVLPADALVGEEGGGFRMAMHAIDKSRVHIAAVCVGLADRLIHEALTYAMQRKQFGQPIAEFQLIQAMLADSRAEQLAARALVEETARKADKGEPYSLEASCCKLFASEMVSRVADRAVQIHGGAGYMRDSAVERLYRDSRIFRIFEGTSQIQQITIAKQMVKRAQAGSTA
jgi:acyl-CoA dehydrogenase